MKSFFDKLTPAERRLVVFVGIAVFVVINIWFIIPKFGEYGKLEKKRDDTLKLIGTYRAEIARKAAYEKLIRELSNVGDIASEAAANKLAEEVSSQAALSGLEAPNIGSVAKSGSGGKTNTFFEEASVSITFKSGEKELIDFLYRLADKAFLIRAKSLEIQPEPPGRTKLQGRISLVKSFQRKAPPKPAPSTPRSAPAAPATNTAPKPAPPAPTRTIPAPANSTATPGKK